MIFQLRLLMFMLVFLFINNAAMAEIIKFKNGNVVEKTIIEKTDEAVKVDAGGGATATFYMDEIESIADSPKIVPEEIKAERVKPVTTVSTPEEDKGRVAETSSMQRLEANANEINIVREKPPVYDEKGNRINEPSCSDISGIGIKKLYDINKEVIVELICEDGKKKVILAYDNGRPKGMVFFENGTIPIRGSFMIPVVNTK